MLMLLILLFTSGISMISSDLSFDYLGAKSAAQEVLNLIYHRYELSGNIGPEFFYTTNNIGAFTFDVIKYKIAAKAMRGNQTFVMIFGGSSVTAGHDSYFNQSFPMIVKSRMAPAFEKLGIKLVVRNIALGANPCIPYIYCYESMGGLNPDFVAWEQAYNCGHAPEVYEVLARSAQQSKAITYYSASGAWVPNDCPLSTESVPYCAEEWKPAEAKLSPWIPGAQEVQHIKQTLDRYHRAKPSAQRFIPDVMYEPWAHGFNVWETNPECRWTNKKGKADVGCNGIDAAQKCTLKFMSKEASYFGHGGHGADWHPSRAFHMLRGEAVTWLYLLALLDAVFMIEQDRLNAKTSPDKMLAQYESALETKYRENNIAGHHPKHCASDADSRLQVPCPARPVCYSEHLPHYTRLTLGGLLVGSTNWQRVDYTYTDWSRKYGYLDGKPYYAQKAGAPTDEIHIVVQVQSAVSFVWLCGALHHTLVFVDLNYPFPESVRHHLEAIHSDLPFDVDQYQLVDAHVSSDGSKSSSIEYTPTKNRQLWTNKKYIGSDCKAINNLPPGLHVISLSTNTTHPNHVTTLTHVITWP